MTPEELAKRHPHLYHLTEREAVPKILEHGLWSTGALVRACGLSATEEHALLKARRRTARSLDHPILGNIVISDNRPLSEGRLARLLNDGLTVSDWLGILNDHVFFWARASFAENLREAQNNRNRGKTLLVFETLPLVRAHFSSASISPLNSGATRTETRRGLDTFSKVENTDFTAWRRRRSPTVLDDIKEIVVERGVPDAGRYLHKVIDLAP